MHRLRTLTLALIFSGSLNIGLFTVLILSSFEKSKNNTFSPQYLQSHQLFDKLIKNSISELVASLTHKEMRELSLAILVAKHDFDLERALGHALQPYSLVLSDGEQLNIYPGVTEEEYEAVIRFAYQEKYPFHSKGLFYRLKNQPKESRDSDLEEAFFITPEFYVFQMLFQKSGMIVDKKILLDLVCEGPWEQLSFLAANPIEALDFSFERRQAVLSSYLACGSEIAAQLLQLGKEEPSPAPLPLLKKRCEEPVFPSSPKFQEHVVKEGENLWKISRQYHVKLDELRKLNELDGERLYPGMTLLIPAR